MVMFSNWFLLIQDGMRLNWLHSQVLYLQNMQFWRKKRMNKQSLLLRNKLFLIYFSFVITFLVVIMAFITATTYIQLALAILLYPLLAFFAYKILPIKQENMESTPQPVTPFIAKTERVVVDTKIDNKNENISISDIDKRVFLKLIGGTGLALFLFSIFNKRAESIFFKSLPGSGRISLENIAGNKIDPAQKKPLDDYSISDVLNSDITFYGFVSKDGAWYIMRVDTQTGTFRYAKDSSSYSDNWNNRANLKYDLFDNVF